MALRRIARPVQEAQSRRAGPDCSSSIARCVRYGLLCISRSATRGCVSGGGIVGGEGGAVRRNRGLGEGLNRELYLAAAGVQYLRRKVSGKTGPRWLIAQHDIRPVLARLAARDVLCGGQGCEQAVTQRLPYRVFRFSTGEQPHSFNAVFRRLLTDAGLLRDGLVRTPTLYSLHHTYATLALLAGTDIHTLARQIGTSVVMLERHYSKFTPTLAAEQLAGGRWDREKMSALCHGAPRCGLDLHLGAWIRALPTNRPLPRLDKLARRSQDEKRANRLVERERISSYVVETSAHNCDMRLAKQISAITSLEQDEPTTSHSASKVCFVQACSRNTCCVSQNRAILVCLCGCVFYRRRSTPHNVFDSAPLRDWQRNFGRRL